MVEFTIDGKKYYGKATLGNMKRAFVQKKLQKANESQNLFDLLEFSYEIVWKMLVKKGLFKPYIFFKRFKNNVDVKEIDKAAELLTAEIFKKEGDGEPGN